MKSVAEPQAWVVRMNTGGGDVVEQGLRDGQLLLGWSAARGLADRDSYWDFREVVHKAHYSRDQNYKRSGRAAGQLWNFIKVMRPGDLVVVPHGPNFYVGEIADGPFEFSEEGGNENDTAHRRPVNWLSSAIPRTTARSALISRMKAYGTVTSASDLVPEVREALESSEQGVTPSLLPSLRLRLIENTKQELETGFLDERRFERLVADLLISLGAVDAHVVARQKDIGADIEADFSVGHLTTGPVRVQVKYWQGKAGRGPVEQLLNAMEDVQIGVVVTTAAFSDEAREFAAAQSEETGKQIVLVDGDELSRLIVEHALSDLLARREM